MLLLCLAWVDSGVFLSVNLRIDFFFGFAMPLWNVVFLNVLISQFLRLKKLCLKES